jgi:hypothetical protein
MQGYAASHRRSGSQPSRRYLIRCRGTLAAVARIIFGIALLVLVVTTIGGPGWLDVSTSAVLATHLEHTAASPLYDTIASAFAYLPVGEAGFRLALLAALLGAIAVAGAVRAARALLPKDPVAWICGALLLMLAPPFRIAAAMAAPSLLAACGVVWGLALAVEHARQPAAGKANAALACAAVVVGSAPWLGAPFLVAITLYLARAGAARTQLAIGVGAIGALSAVYWIGALGRMPDPDFDLHAFVASSGYGAAAVLAGVGLLGIAFAAATRLRDAIWLALVLAIVILHALFVDHGAVIALPLLAVGASILPSAIVRLVPRQRHLVAAAATVPLVAAALLLGPLWRADDPGDAPSRLASDLLDEQPPGPGVFVARRAAAWNAIQYEQAIAGARPDLALVPPLPPSSADVIVKRALVEQRIAASDVFAFGRLNPQWSLPRGRSFQLLLAEPRSLAAIRPPAHYASAIGEEEAVLAAVTLARYEAGFGRLDAAAHAAGLSGARFNAADLAMLATARPVHTPLFGLLPDFGTTAGPWMLDLFGDDLAWVAGMKVEDPPQDAPTARRLHALWRRLLAGTIKADDPAIAALGQRAVTATADLEAALAAAKH